MAHPVVRYLLKICRGAALVNKQENREIVITPCWLDWEYVRSSGPGGQKVNKTSSKVRLRFDLWGCRQLPSEVKHRIYQAAHGRINEEGHLILESETSRHQNQNKQNCLDKLHTLIRQAMNPPKRRRPTRPTAGSRTRRLREKKRRSQLKTQRRNLDGQA